MATSNSELTPDDVRRCFKENEKHFLAQKDVISKKGIRRYMEEKLSVEKGGLDIHKALISGLCDQLISTEGQTDEQSQVEEEKAPPKLQKPQRKETSMDGRNRPDKSVKEAVRKAKKAKSCGAQQGETSSGHSRRVARLKDVCKAATITVGPSIYRGKDEAVIYERLVALLAKHNLSPDASSSEIKLAPPQSNNAVKEFARRRTQAVKLILRKERDLDGIDTSNIIEGRPRRAAAAGAEVAVNRYASKLGKRRFGVENNSPAGSDDSGREGKGAYEASSEDEENIEPQDSGSEEGGGRKGGEDDAEGTRGKGDEEVERRSEGRRVFVLDDDVDSE